MEEILASIRRIISEDEAPSEAAAPELPEHSPEPVPEPTGRSTFQAPEDEPEPERAFAPTPEPESDDDGDLELTQRVETHGDLDFVEVASPEPEPVAELPPELPAPTGEALVSDHVAAAAAATFGKLTSNLLVPHSDRTLEDVVRDLLRPMLQQWLDENLPGIVQQAVEAEVERIARGRPR